MEYLSDAEMQARNFTADEYRRYMTRLLVETDPNPIKGPTWTTEEMLRDFRVIQVSAPCVIVVRKADNIGGSMMFKDDPRIYFDFIPGSPTYTALIR